MTLIEVLVAMGIITIAGFLLVVIIVNSAGLFSKQSSKVQTGLNINDALLQVRNGIRQASAVATSYTSGSTTYTSGNDQLVLKITSVDSSGNMIEDIFDYFVFLKDGNFLRYKIFPDSSSSRASADTIFSTSVDNLKFEYLNSANPPVSVSPEDASKVRITLTLKQKAGADTETQTSTSEANLRND